MDEVLESAVVIDEAGPELQRKLRMGGKFAADLLASHGEDVATWNLFQAIQRVDPNIWMPRLFSAASIEPPRVTSHSGLRFSYWPSVAPTKARLAWMRDHVGAHGVKAHPTPGAAMEGPSQVDVMIHHPEYTVIVEVKRLFDLSTKVSYQDGYDQLARQLDVAEGVEAETECPAYVWLLVLDRQHQPIGFERARAYRSPAHIREVCAHFSEEQAARRAARLGLLTWFHASAVLEVVARDIGRVVEWLREQGLSTAAQRED
jgi:hypothetical protein